MSGKQILAAIAMVCSTILIFTACLTFGNCYSWQVLSETGYSQEQRIGSNGTIWVAPVKQSEPD